MNAVCQQPALTACRQKDGCDRLCECNEHRDGAKRNRGAFMRSAHERSKRDGAKRNRGAFMRSRKSNEHRGGQVND